MIWSYPEIGWPWLCLGGGLTLFTVMFFSDATRKDLTISRWRDPAWLAWLVVAMLMVHMFEEYGFDMLGRSYIFPDGLCKNLGLPAYPDCPVPRGHYPLLNVGIAFITAPIAAALGRKNPVIGLSFFGLVIINGIAHVGGTIRGGLEAGAGLITGALFFIPGFIWVIYSMRKSGALSGKALAVSLSAGAITHIVLIVALASLKSVGYPTSGVFAADVIIDVLPIILAWAGSKLVSNAR